MSDREAHQERRRVLFLFAFSILPPLVLLMVLAVVAARNDEAALNYVEQERTRQAAGKARDALLAALLEAEDAVFAALDPALVDRLGSDPASGEAALGAVRQGHTLAGAFFVLDDSGRLIWPPARLPFLYPEGGRVPEEHFALSEGQDFRRLAELQALYDRSVLQQRAGNLANAAAGFRTVSGSKEATAILSCRAAYRLGVCLEDLEQPVVARLAYERAAGAVQPVRDDEEGLPLRVEARLASAELALATANRETAGREAISLGRELIGGALSEDLREGEWSSALRRVRMIATSAGRASEAADLMKEGERIAARLAWLQILEEEAEGLVVEARRSKDKTRTYAVPTREPVLLAYQARADDDVMRLVGFRLELERLAQDVLTPTCATLASAEEAVVAVVDAEGGVKAHGGAEDAAKVEGGESLSLGALPWEVRVRRSTSALEQARRNRLLLYGALIILTLVSAVAGAVSTIRYVERSLELAKMKSDFLSNITHELKTPLTSIKMYGEMIAAGRLRTEEKRKEYAEHIVREGDRLHQLIENVLDFARQDSGKHEYVLAEEDVADTVSEAIDLFRLSAKARGFDLFVELPPVRDLPPVDLDRDAIVRSVLNLLSNAVKYSTDRRYLKVTVRRESREMICVAVEDKGMGIDPVDLEKIFDRFYRAGDELTRAISGAGLGLSLVDHIVRAHQGEIQVESERGRGSVFTILLPVVEDYREQWPPPELDEDPLAKTVDGESATHEAATDEGSAGSGSEVVSSETT